MKLINRYKFISIFLLSVIFVSCESLLEENKVGGKFNDEIIFQNPILAEGVLLRAYTMMPNEYSFNESYATDDAVTNDISSDMITMATGGFTSRYYPLSIYAQSYMHLRRLILLLPIWMVLSGLIWRTLLILIMM